MWLINETFSLMHSIVLNIVPRTLEITFNGFEMSTSIFKGSLPPEPLQSGPEPTAPC